LYSTCISCHAPLGSNAVLEQFPVGRRLAFDPYKGRLWVLCFACRSWNLVPLEERWEAVEAAERLFERAALGSSTENVALGRVSEGTELVRIGRVSRPEFAGWRYGDRLLGRWRKHQRQFWLAIGGGAIIGSVPVLGGAPIIPIIAGAAAIQLLRDRHPILRTQDGQLIRASAGKKALLLPTDTLESWLLSLPQRRGDPVMLEGREALRALRGLLPRSRRFPGTPEQVGNAVDEVERLGSADRVLHEAARDLQHMENMDRRYRWTGARPHRIATGHPVIVLAVEMAANEEIERHALQGELSLLEKEWKEAEELAAISDELLFPRHLRHRLRQWKKDNSPARDA